MISLPAPPLEDIGEPALGREMAQLANEGLAGLVEERPERFAGWVAGGRRGQSATRDLTNVAGVPWDDPRFAPFWDAMAELDAMTWVHPSRNVTWADYPTESRSRYEIWWALGWPHETSLFMARIAFSGLFDRRPGLRILTHHGGGTVPHLEGRIAGGWDQLGSP